MAWTFIGVGAAGTATGTPLSLTEPAGVRDGDLLIACIASRTTSLTSITNTGWTLVAEQKTNNIATDTTAVASGAMFRRVREGTTDLTFTLPASGTSVAFGRIIAYRGVLQATPADISAASTTAVNTTAVSVTGLTTTQANDLIVAMCAGGRAAAWSAFDAATDPSVASGATNTSTPPTAGTWIERADSSTTTGADTSLAIFDAIKASASATGNLTATASLAASHVVIAGAFRISPAATADAWDISDKTPSAVLSNSDKTVTFFGGGSASLVYARSSTKRANGTAGKYYAEFVAHELTSGMRVGISNATADYPSANAFYATDSGPIQVDAVSVGIDLGIAADGDIFCVAWDAGAERVWFRRNNGFWNNNASADPATNANGIDVSAHASVDHALWARLDATGVNVTVRTEAAEFTQSPLPSGFTSWMGEVLSSVTHYTMPAAVGTVTLAGVATGVRADRRMAAATGAVAVTYTAADLRRAYTLSVAAGAVVVTFNDANLVVTAAKRLTADAGAITITGYAAALRRTPGLLAAKGTITLAGIDVNLSYRRAYAMPALKGAVTVTFNDASLTVARRLAAGTGAIVLSGQAVALRHARVMPLAAGAVTVTGYPAALSRTGSYTLAANTGAVTVSMQTAALRRICALLAAPGGIVVTGHDADLIYATAEAGYTLNALTGAIVVTGQGASLDVARALPPDTKQPGVLRFGRRVVAIPSRW